MNFTTPLLPKPSPTHAGVLPPLPPSLVKTTIVAVLSCFLAWRPTIAMALGRLIWWFLPWLQEA